MAIYCKTSKKIQIISLYNLKQISEVNLSEDFADVEEMRFCGHGGLPNLFIVSKIGQINVYAVKTGLINYELIFHQPSLDNLEVKWQI